ncbi:glycosyltransferase family 4 protein [Tamlana fucoidanivorans]|uniref:Glycosyltransferase family 4 protein n=1 Tax=Allotamlana fucoidanivorans TaxID=2583814 RepID=A0A5C4SPE5_9FLAO|nr:glycosyltransferase family 4 protein [Tamlana fucoidanivorans]TNJ45750.1 glycosyltransferase family 4 protein [Tamlana fucoidanivorans]
MKVLQLIDSLHAGGAERVAVNLANALSKYIESSYLCTTREEGVLKASIDSTVSYLFLNKKQTLDVKAIKKLNTFIKANNIDVIHAHSSSFFIGTVIRMLNPKLILVWHDHYGKSEALHNRSTFAIKLCSKFFSHIFAVNSKLEAWSKIVLNKVSVTYLPNFAHLNISKSGTILQGKDGCRIIHLANFRQQKDHLTLLEAYAIIFRQYPDWTLHLVGKNFSDKYFTEIKRYIEEEKLNTHVYIYGSAIDVSNILNQSDIGALSSQSEGLPLALLEYGLSKLPVVCTNVGDCQKVISNLNEGILVNPNNAEELAKGIEKLIRDKDLRQVLASGLHQKVITSFSEKSTMHSLLNIYKSFI